MSKQEIPSCVRRKEVGIPAKKCFYGKFDPVGASKLSAALGHFSTAWGTWTPQGNFQKNPKVKENKPWTYQRRKRRRDGMIKIKKQLKGRRIQECCKRKRGFYLHLQLPTALILILSPTAHGFVTPEHHNSQKTSPGFGIFNANAFPRNWVTWNWKKMTGRYFKNTICACQMPAGNSRMEEKDAKLFSIFFLNPFFSWCLEWEVKDWKGKGVLKAR